MGVPWGLYTKNMNLFEFKEGDIIVQIEQKRITSLKDLTSALNEYKKTKKRVIINRQNFRAILVMP